VARNVRFPLLACFACAAALCLLAIVVLGIDAGRHLDVRLFLRLRRDPHSEGGELTDEIAALADLLPMLLLLAGACAIALVRRRPGDALAAVFVVAGANVTTQLLKFLFAHPRVKVAIGGNPFEPSTFPSGHTTAAASLAIAYLFVVPAALRKPVAIAGAAFVFAVGCSVVVIGWHFPSDVIGALLVAAGWGFAALTLRRAISSQRRRSAGVRPRAPLPSP
jgi:membrane-associated phospholipid phosphatase